MIELEKILACPKCRSGIKKNALKCPKCKLPYKFQNGIWHLLDLKGQKTRLSQKEYEELFQKNFGGPKDGSYEILSMFSKGNKTLDIACGTGLLEKLAPKTVGLDFSLSALTQAQKNGAKFLVLGDAQNLPFKDNSFDLSISSGNLEHFENPQKAIQEMARVSVAQIVIAHRLLPFPFPFGKLIYKLATLLFSVKHQPIENPIAEKEVERMLIKSNLKIIYKGVWTLPVNYGRVIKLLPELKGIPSSSFFVTIRK